VTSSIRSKWDQLLKTFKYILTFEGYTGNGGGNRDSDGDGEDMDKEVKVVAKWLKAACDQG